MAICERDVEAYLVQRVKALGGEVRKVKWIGRKGAPDRLVLLPGCSVWVEIKRPRACATPGQLREHERLRSAGQIVLVLDTFGAVDAWVTNVEPWGVV